MSSLSSHIMEHAVALPDATPLTSSSLLHLGNRNAVNQALVRLTRSGDLMRICRGIYMRMIETRFGPRGPDTYLAIAELSKMWDETIVPSGGAAANCLGLTTQNQVRPVYLTSGPSRQLKFGNLIVCLRHAPQWQLVAPHRKAGQLIRAFTFLHPTEIEDSLEIVLPTFSDEDLEELAATLTVIPNWMAAPLSTRLSHG